MKQYRSRNYPLYIGFVLSAFFVLVALVGPSLAPQDPLEQFNDVLFIGDRSYIPSRNPIPPFRLEMFPLGTDNAGRDLLSRLLNAVRPTLILSVTIVVVRLLIGTSLGLLAGWYQRAERLIDTLVGISLSVPILLFALAAISFIGHKTLPTFILALTVTGWANTAVFVKNSTRTTMQAPYIEGARAVGVKPLGILRYYILPQLWTALPALLAFELGAVILVIAELGFLGIFIGEAYVIIGESANTAGTVALGLTAGTAELAQMLSDFWSKMIHSPWEVVFVALAIFLQIFAFNMLGEGLRRQMDITRPGRARWRNRLIRQE
ncbi:MAG: ABC transporter permease [Ardenticatenaceae bacterium]|nr:ABC transporter permease [Anaerolineales bacterium]MCB8921970.1 ABC transporter permease [Ardenticatenaceae bacterium]MCB8989546.1 ABC transporter permease [Ardenticatenaceae bacterium]MCB9003089.1 ABC transporter permease [Ardenticatenaceae bacterium]